MPSATTITNLPDLRVLHPTVSNSPTPASLYPQNLTTSINATSRARVCTTCFVHQWVTCNNNPFAPLANEEPDDPTGHAPTDCSSNDATITTSKKTPTRTHLPPQSATRRIVLTPQPAPVRPPHLTVIQQILYSGHAIQVPPMITPTQQYIQQTRNKALHAPAPSVPTPIPRAKPTKATHLTPTTPPIIYPPTKPATPFNTHPVPVYIKPDNDDRDNTPSQPNRSAIQFYSLCRLASISRQALYHVINLAFNSPPMYTIPQALSGLPNCILHCIDIKEVCNGVVHPVTKETITKYTKLMNNPVISPL